MAELAPTSKITAVTRTYLLVPCVLLAVFFVFQRDFQKKRDQREREHAAQVAATRAGEEAQREEQRRLALEEQRRRTEERERREREREDAKRRDYEAALLALDTQTDAHIAAADKLEREIASIEALLAQRRTRRQQAEEETFELEKQIELQRIDRRSAEIEVQRTARMVLARLLESSWANPSAPPGM